MVPDDSYWHVALPDKPVGVKGRPERKMKKRRNQPKLQIIGTKGEAPKDQYGVIVSSDLNRQIVTVKWFVNCDTLDDTEKKLIRGPGEKPLRWKERFTYNYSIGLRTVVVHFMIKIHPINTKKK